MQPQGYPARQRAGLLRRFAPRNDEPEPSLRGAKRSTAERILVAYPASAVQHYVLHRARDKLLLLQSRRRFTDQCEVRIGVGVEISLDETELPLRIDVALKRLQIGQPVEVAVPVILGEDPTREHRGLQLHG